MGLPPTADERKENDPRRIENVRLMVHQESLETLARIHSHFPVELPEEPKPKKATEKPNGLIDFVSRKIFGN